MKKATTSRTATGVMAHKQMSQAAAFRFGQKLLRDYGATDDLIRKLLGLDLPYDEVEYVSIPNELLWKDSRIWEKIIRYACENGAVLQVTGDTGDVAIIDDKMSPQVLDKLVDLLEGHPTESVKLKVLRKR